MKLISLFESDQQTRNLERAASGEDANAIIALAINYLRTGNAKIDSLIDPLLKMNDPNAKEIIKAWAEINDIPTAEEFVKNLKSTDGLNFTTAETAAVKAGLKSIEYDQNGRGGYYYHVNIYRSPADGNYVWLVFGNEEGNRSFNYGSISTEDLALAKKDYGGDEKWQSWGMLDYFRDYLY